MSLVANKASFLTMLEKAKELVDKLGAELVGENGHDWLLGPSFSLVDIQLGVLLAHLAKLGYHSSKEGIQKFLQRFNQRSAVQEVLLGQQTLQSREACYRVEESGAGYFDDWMHSNQENQGKAL